jgi:Predicted SAM-dependent methyltransferases
VYIFVSFQIIVGDCVEILNQFIAEGRKFDYVFGDLTDIPLSASPQGEVWDFIRLILNSALTVLKPQGKYMTHVSMMNSTYICLSQKTKFQVLHKTGFCTLEWVEITLYCHLYFESRVDTYSL